MKIFINRALTAGYEKQDESTLLILAAISFILFIVMLVSIYILTIPG